MLSFEISPHSIMRLRELSKRLTELHATAAQMSGAELDFIRRNAFVSNVGASTRIENAVLTNAEVEWIDTTLTEDGKTTAYVQHRDLIHNKLSKDKERSIEEVVGCRGMLNIILREGKELFPLQEVMLRGLHKELLQHYRGADHHSGGYKQVTNCVVRRTATGQTPVLETAAPGLETQTAMAELVAWYNRVLPQHPWSIAVAVEMVFRFLAIHPFQDGNGRLGRGLFSLILLQSPDDSVSFAVPFLPIDRWIEKEREDYYHSLRRCSEGRFQRDPTRYEYEPFLRFMINVVQSAIEDFGFYRRRYANYMSLADGARTVLACFKEYPEKKLQMKMILAETGLPRRTTNDALNRLIEGEFIQRYGRGPGTRYQLVF